MMLTITGEQRDALYDQLADRLSGIDDIWLAVCAKDFDSAKRLGMEYSDDLRLVSEDLGWGEGSGEDVELSMPPDVLRRALSRMRDVAVTRDACEQQERAEAREAERRNHLVVEACQSVLARLDSEQADG